MEAAASLYRHGVAPDFAGMYRPWPRRKLDLPTYPFQRQRYWVEIEQARRLEPNAALARFLYEIAWQPLEPVAPRTTMQPSAWLLLSDAGGVGARLAELLQ